MTGVQTCALPIYKGWYHTSIFGIYGAAAAAARLLKLDVEKTQHAFGIALSQTAATQLPSMSFSLAKRFSSSFAAHAGVFSALLAARGITAPREAFEGKFGFYDLYQPGDASALFADIGRTYPHVATAIKKYPSCACNHTAIEATLGLVREHDLKVDDASALEVTISPYVHRLVGAPFEPGSDPQVAAQFSVQYAVACALMHRRLSVADIQDDAVREPALGALARGVRVVVEEKRGVARHDAGIAQGIRELLRRCVLGFDDAFERAVLGEHQAAIGIGHAPLEAEHDDVGIGPRRHDAVDGRGREQRRIAIQHRDVAGESFQRSLRLTHGMTRAELLRLDSGTLQAGKSADFIVLDANPLDDITNTRRINKVFLRGNEVPRAALAAAWQAQMAQKAAP